MSKKLIVIMGSILVVIVGIFLLPHKSTSTAASLSSMSTGPAPWTPEYVNLPSRLEAIKMPLLDAEGSALHIHAHVDIFVHGKAVTVPANIGIPPSGGITPVHTHDTTGIVHIESPDAHAHYTLGQFFAIWGVKLTDESLGSYMTSNMQKLVVYSNGSVVSDPVNLVLTPHQEIEVTYGTKDQMPTIATTYTFPNGL